MRRLLDSRDSLDKLYRDASSSLPTLARSHRFTMSELDHHRDELRATHTEVSQLNKLLSSKDSIIKELRASKKLVSHELDIAMNMDYERMMNRNYERTDERTIGILVA
jgi:hypothetical protein